MAGATASPSTAGYFPRYHHRDPGPDGRPDEDGVRTVSIVATLPPETAMELRLQTASAIGDLAQEPRVRFVPTRLLHVTAADMCQGNNRLHDQAIIDSAHIWQRQLMDIAATLTPIRLTLNGLTLSNRQIMATYEGDAGWDSFVRCIDEIERTVPELSRRYDLRRCPLEPGAKVLQTTVAVFDDGVPMRDLAERLERYLPGPASQFSPRGYSVPGLHSIVWEFSPEYLMRTVSALAYAPLQSATNYRPGPVTPAPALPPSRRHDALPGRARAHAASGVRGR